MLCSKIRAISLFRSFSVIMWYFIEIYVILVITQELLFNTLLCDLLDFEILMRLLNYFLDTRESISIVGFEILNGFFLYFDPLCPYERTLCCVQEHWTTSFKLTTSATHRRTAWLCFKTYLLRRERLLVLLWRWLLKRWCLCLHSQDMYVFSLQKK